MTPSPATSPPQAEASHAKRAANYWRARRISAFLKIYSRDNDYFRGVFNALGEHIQ